jgi:hypothetical protein
MVINNNNNNTYLQLRALQIIRDHNEGDQQVGQ